MINKIFSQYTALPKGVYVLFASKTINSMGNFVLPLLTLILTEKVMLPKSTAGIYLTILSIFYAPGLILGGKLVDSIGRKKIIIFFHGLAGIIFILCGSIKPSIYLVYLLICSTTCFSVTLPAYDALIADLTDKNNRKAAYSLLYMGHNLGFAIGPVIGGLLYHKYLNFVFYGDALTTFVSIALIYLFIKEIKHHADNNALEASNMEKSEEGSVISVLLKRKVLIYFALLLFFYNFAYSQWGFTMPLQLSESYKENGARYYGYMAGFNGLIIIMITPLLTRITSHLKALRVMGAGGILYALAFGMLGFVSILPLYFVSVFIMTVGEVIISINTSTFIASHTPASHRGRVNAVLPMVFGAGYTLGPIAMGRMLNIYPTRTAWSLVSFLVLLAGLLMLVLQQFYNFSHRNSI